MIPVLSIYTQHFAKQIGCIPYYTIHIYTTPDTHTHTHTHTLTPIMPSSHKRQRQSIKPSDEGQSIDPSTKAIKPLYITPASNPIYTSYNNRLSEWCDRGKCGDTEYYDPPDLLNNKIDLLIQLIQQSSYCIVFTGAGISTSCGINDFRSPNGVWTQQEKQYKSNDHHHRTNSTSTNDVLQSDPIVPSLTHMALSTLMQHKCVQYIISQNIDCLHLRSGVPRNKLCEVHGNLYAEQCHNYRVCGYEYIRSYDMNGIGCQLTDRMCDNQLCRSPLYDKTYDWTTNLATEELNHAIRQFDTADLCIVLGTSLRVDPAGRWPLKLIKRYKHVVVINLQKTYIDNKCTIRIYEKCDTVMNLLMNKLNIPINEYNPNIILPPFIPKHNKYVNISKKQLIPPDVPAYMKHNITDHQSTAE